MSDSGDIACVQRVQIIRVFAGCTLMMPDPALSAFGQGVVGAKAALGMRRLKDDDGLWTLPTSPFGLFRGGDVTECLGGSDLGRGPRGRVTFPDVAEVHVRLIGA